MSEPLTQTTLRDAAVRVLDDGHQCDFDPGIARVVHALMDAGVETFESCQGGEGHCYSEPTVRFGVGRPEEGWKALSVCLMLGFPVLQLSLSWSIEHHHVPTSCYWEIVLREQVPHD